MNIDISSRKFIGESFNPDAMELSDLIHWREELSGDPMTLAKEWLPTYPPESAAQVMIDLWLYCVGKVAAVEHRLAGRIAKAQAYEKELERVYRRLPKGVQW